MKCLEKCTSPCPTINVHKWLHFVTGLIGNKKANAFENGKGTLVSSCTLLVFRLYWTQVKKKNQCSRHARISDTDNSRRPQSHSTVCCFVTNEGHVTKRNRRALIWSRWNLASVSYFRRGESSCSAKEPIVENYGCYLVVWFSLLWLGKVNSRLTQRPSRGREQFTDLSQSALVHNNVPNSKNDVCCQVSGAMQLFVLFYNRLLTEEPT